MKKYITEKRLICIQEIMLFLAIFVIPITVLPKKASIFLLGPVLSQFFVAIGLVTACLWVHIYNVKIDKRIKIFILIFLGWECLSNVYAVISFPYYSLIKTLEIAKLTVILDKLSAVDVYLDNNFAIKAWVFLRSNYTIIKDFVYGYGFSIWVYYLYKGRWKELYKVINVAVCLVLLIIGVYSLVEIGYLKGNALCTEILKMVNPYLYDPASGRGWWPPLLWNNQLRSIFPEPSFCGLFLSFALPFLYITYIKEDKYIALLASIYFSFLLFLTKARTANLLYIGMMILIILGIVLFYKKYIKKLLIILLSSIIVFFASVQFETISFHEEKSQPSNIETAVTEYVTENITSISANQRSNTARFVVFVSSYKVYLEHPIFGVGNILYGPYLVEKIPDWGKKDGEVNQWLQNMHDDGILKNPFPSFYEILNRGLYYGTLGILLYILPVVFIFYNLLVKRQIAYNIHALGLFISYSVCLAFMLCSSYAFLTYYLATGGLLVYINENKREELYQNETNY